MNLALNPFRHGETAFEREFDCFGNGVFGFADGDVAREVLCIASAVGW